MIARKSRKFDNLCCESSQPTVEYKAHKTRTTLKFKWIFKRASGNRCPHDAGKTQPPRKAAATAAAATILCQYIRRQSPTAEKKRILREDRIWTTILEWHTWRRHDSMIIAQWRSDSNVLGCFPSSIVNGSVYKNPKINWKETSRVWIGNIAFTVEASSLKFGRCSCNPKTINGLFHQEHRITQRSMQEYNVSSKWSLLSCRSWAGSIKERSERSCTGGVRTCQ